MADFSELWRERCIAYSLIRDIVNERCYPQHISGVTGAVFPAISLYPLPRLRTNYGVVDGLYQMDTWAYTEEEARILQDYLEHLYHPDFVDSLPRGRGVAVRFLLQISRKDGAYEKDTGLFHKIGIYVVVWEDIS